jgi:SAM-dependent methyltransferase
MTTARYDAFADWYHDWVGEDARRDFTCLATVDALGAAARGRVLDLACGSGRIARYLADRGAAVVGVDLSAALIAKAVAVEQREPRGIQYLVGSAQDTAWWDGTPFDGAACHMGLSDIDDLDAAMATVRTVLRPGGAFAFLILHPCFPGSGDGLPSWPPDKGYYWEGWWTTQGSGCRGRVGANHRTLSTYLAAPLANGLRIERVLEPVPPADAAEAMAKLPSYLLISCRKT